MLLPFEASPLGATRTTTGYADGHLQTPRGLAVPVPTRPPPLGRHLSRESGGAPRHHSLLSARYWNKWDQLLPYRFLSGRDMIAAPRRGPSSAAVCPLSPVCNNTPPSPSSCESSLSPLPAPSNPATRKPWLCLPSQQTYSSTSPAPSIILPPCLALPCLGLTDGSLSETFPSDRA